MDTTATTTTEAAGSRQVGVIKSVVVALGFGFVWHPRGDVFVHFSDMAADQAWPLRVGESVSFRVIAGPKGLRATEVQRVAAAVAAEPSEPVAKPTSSPSAPAPAAATSAPSVPRPARRATAPALTIFG